VYADWLEENGRLERAEFVRLQLDLARAPACDHFSRPDVCQACAWRQREDELLAAHGTAWLEAELPGPGWEVRRSADWMPRQDEERRGGQCLAFYSRGLVEVLFLPLDEFLRAVQQIFAHPLPIRRVQLTDRQPRFEPGTGYCWSDRPRDEGMDHYLPHPLCDYLPSAPLGDAIAGGRPSEEDAVAAVSRACLAYGWNLDLRAIRKRVFTTGQVAKLCKVAPRTVCKWFDAGKLRGYRIPGSQDRRVPRDNLLRFLRENGMPLDDLEPDWEAGAVWAARDDGLQTRPTQEEDGLPIHPPTQDQAEPPPQRPRAQRRPAPAPEPLDLEALADSWRQAALRIVSNDHFTVGEVALLMQVASRTVRKWIDAGRLHADRVGKSQQRRVPREDLIRFLQEHGLPLPAGMVGVEGEALTDAPADG
jgi:excisionase family DNA binding protein